jgi:hypothetical protein
MAMRPEGLDGLRDISDIEFLAGEIGIQNSDSALALIEEFYPRSRIPAKVAFGVQEIMERIVRRKEVEQTKPFVPIRFDRGNHDEKTHDHPAPSIGFPAIPPCRFNHGSEMPGKSTVDRQRRGCIPRKRLRRLLLLHPGAR